MSLVPLTSNVQGILFTQREDERHVELSLPTLVGPSPDYTTKLQSSRQYALAQKQKYRPMEQDRKPRDKTTHFWAPYL